MHCPSCGQLTTADQQFCRLCGMNLVTIAKLVSDHSPAPGIAERKLQKAESERVLQQRMVRWMMWGMLVMGLGVVMLVANKSFDLGKLFNLISAIVLLTGVGIATYGVLAAMRDGASLKGKTSSKSIAEAETTKSLSSPGVPVELPSVTERTTQLIGDVERREENGN